MKTIQKYTQRSMPLFVGLLSLHTLSSCSHTKQALGMGCVDRTTHWIKRNPVKTAIVGFAAGTFTGLCLGAGTMSSIQNGSTPSTAGNPTTPSPPTSSTTLSTTTPTPSTSSTTLSTTTLAPSTSSTTLSTTTVVTILSSLPTMAYEEQQKIDEELFQAIEAHNQKKIEHLIQNNPTLNVNAINKDGYTPLIQAVLKENENTDIVRLLLDNGANVDQKGGVKKLMPLSHAILLNRKNMVEILLDHHAKVNEKDSDSDTPLLREILKKNPNVAIITLLLKNGANVDQKGGPLDMTPLAYVVYRDKKNMTKILLENEADVNGRNSDNNTPLMIAVSNHNEAMVQILLAHKPNVNLKNDHGQTALDIAKGLKNDKIIALLASSNELIQ